ncbi:MAG: ComF family protein [Melioribacteraceae bacterium]
MKTNFIFDFLNNFLDFILPRYCLFCENGLDKTEQYLCKQCSLQLNKCNFNYSHEIFKKYFESSKIISELNSLYIFTKDTPIQSLLHSLKYHSNYRIGYYLGKLITVENSNYFANEKIDFIIPVPLHRVKYTERGYNQSHYIALEISKITSIPLDEKKVKRIKNTESQTRLNHIERKDNVKDAFKYCGKNSLEGKNVLLVDDIITTGSTIIECARVLKENGAGKIIAFSAALA